MKILHVSSGRIRIPLEKGGGAEGVLYNISKYLCEKGNDVSIIDRKYHDKDNSFEFLDGVKIIRIDTLKIRPIHILNSRYNDILMNILNEIIFGANVCKLIRKMDFDIIHIHTPFVGLCISMLYPNKFFYTSHQAYWSLNSPGILCRHILMPLETFLMKRAKKVIALNEQLKNKFIEVGINHENIIVTENGVDIKIFSPVANTYDTKVKYDMIGKLNILFVGRITTIKGVEFLIKAADIVANRYNYKDVQFLLVGPYLEFFGSNEIKSEYVKNVFGLVDKFGLQNSVKFLGSISFEELSGLYRAADIFILPSLGELFPLVLLEAMSSGKPLIGTNIMGISSLIKDDWNGFLVRPSNENDIAERIICMLKDPIKTEIMAKNSRLLAEKKYSWDKVVDVLSMSYCETLDEFCT